MKLLTDEALESSDIVANSTMNRSRVAVGVNSYERELRVDSIEFLQEKLTLHSEASWLDLCCGEGLALIEASERLGEGEYRLHGIDLVPMFANSSSRNVRFQCDSVHNLELTTRYDLITCVHGLHYIGDKLRLLSSIEQWVKPSGVFIASFDADGIRAANGESLAKEVTATLRMSRWNVNRRKQLIHCQGPRPIPRKWHYLGCNDQAGPNYTGQPAVNSYYEWR